jgi:ankyrin repeat protein
VRLTQFRYSIALVKVDPELKSILHHVLLNANFDILSYLLETHGEEISFSGVTLENNPATHLSLALLGLPAHRERCLKTYNLLLDFLEARGSAVNDKDRLGRGFLHLACMYGVSSMIEGLAKKGNCDFGLTDKEGETPAHYAIAFK